MRRIFTVLVLLLIFGQVCAQPAADIPEYRVGVDDVLEISVLRPESWTTFVSVALDGNINFPYVGNVSVKDLTLTQIRSEIEKRLSDGYIKYPVVSVALRENRSKKFFVYGEVIKPGLYILEENMTVLKAISVSGGFTKYGSSSRVKILRLKPEGKGYQTIKVNIGEVVSGNSNADIPLSSGDIIVVSEGIF